MSTVQTLRNFLLDVLFPPACLGCGTLITSSELTNKSKRPGLCNTCRNNISLQNGFACAFCHAAVVNGLTCPFCRRDHDLSQLLVAAGYDQPLVKVAVKNYKYRFMNGLSEDLGLLMSQYLRKQVERKVIDLDNIIIVPVPLSKQRLRWRGFNQAELLAEYLSRTFNLELVTALQRTQNRKPQAEIKDRIHRIANMKNVFTSSTPLGQGKNILL